MSDKSVADRVEELFQTYGDERPEELRLLVSQLQSNLAEASKQLMRRLATLFLLWVLCVAIDAGVVEEGQVSSFQIGALKSILWVFPIVIAGQYYLLLNTTALVWLIREAVNFAYKKMLPEAYNLDLEYLTHYPNIVTLAEFTNLNSPSGAAGKLASAFAWLPAISLLIGGVAFFLHGSWLVATSDSVPTLAKWASIAVGAVLVLGAWITVNVADANTQS